MKKIFIACLSAMLISMLATAAMAQYCGDGYGGGHMGHHGDSGYYGYQGYNGYSTPYYAPYFQGGGYYPQWNYYYPQDNYYNYHRGGYGHHRGYGGGC